MTGESYCKFRFRAGSRELPAKNNAPEDRGRCIAKVDALSAEIELVENRLVTVVGGTLEVIKQLATAGDHHEEAATRGVVFGVSLKVFGELGDALRKQSDLHIGAARIFVVEAKRLSFRCF